MNQRLKEQIQSGIRETFLALAKVKEWSLETLPEVALDMPKEAKHGDVATNFALMVAKPLKQSPKAIAGVLVETLQSTKVFPASFVQKIEVAGPGFINFYFAQQVLYDELQNVLLAGKSFGRAAQRKKEKVHIEFVSANPTGPLNVVSARTAAVGDVLARLLDAVGYDVFREYYINDAGRQVLLLGQSVEARYGELVGEKVSFPEEGYAGEYVVESARHLLKKYGKEPLQWSAKERENKFAQEAVALNVAAQKEILSRYRVHYDNWFSEKAMRDRPDHPMRKILEQLEDWNTTYQQEGAQWFASTQFGDDKDRVLVTQEGEPTYFLADIAYHKDKFTRGFRRCITLLGPDHHGYYPRVLAAMHALGFPRECFQFRLVQQVNLLQKGEKVKMSKRAGNLVEMRELLEEVGVDAARYFFVLRKLDSHLDFDLDLAREQSANNPVYYVQYAHARICSIFRKVQEEEAEELPQDWSMIDLQPLQEKEEVALMKLLIHFPELVEGAAVAMEPLRLPNYLQEVCALFHVFYTQHRVRVKEEPLRLARLALLKATRTVIHNALELLGVSAPEAM